MGPQLILKNKPYYVENVSTTPMLVQVQALRRANVDAQQRLAVAQDEIRSLEMTISEVRCHRDHWTIYF